MAGGEDDASNSISNEIQIKKLKQLDQNRQNQLKLLEQMREKFNEMSEKKLGQSEDEEAEEEEKKKQEKKLKLQQQSRKTSLAEEDDMFKIKELDDKQFEQKMMSAKTDQEPLIEDEDPDDDQNYLKLRIGEVLNKQYRIVKKLGKGVFSNVCQAIDLETNGNVAIKILRRDEIMLQAGEKEKKILEILNNEDKLDKKHIIRLKNSFYHKQHLCLVFELMDMNLREAIKAYAAKGTGLPLDAVRSFGQQLFMALLHMKKLKIIHGDIKPDNILLSSDTKTVKLCDFGTAFFVEEATLVEYMVSRFYRAPEVMLRSAPLARLSPPRARLSPPLAPSPRRTRAVCFLNA